MANKTQPTKQPVSAYLKAIESPERLADCKLLTEMMAGITGASPVMWGDSIVGFGQYHYRYDSGREGDFLRTGFSSRKDSISIYLLASGPDQAALLEKLGKHRMGKACLYVKRLSDIDLDVLEQLIVDSVEELARRYPAE